MFTHCRTLDLYIHTHTHTHTHTYKYTHTHTQTHTRTHTRLGLNRRRVSTIQTNGVVEINTRNNRLRLAVVLQEGTSVRCAGTKLTRGIERGGNGSKRSKPIRRIERGGNGSMRSKSIRRIERGGNGSKRFATWTGRRSRAVSRDQTGMSDM